MVPLFASVAASPPSMLSSDASPRAHASSRAGTFTAGRLASSSVSTSEDIPLISLTRATRTPLRQRSRGRRASSLWSRPRIPTLQITNLPRATKLGHAAGALVAVDNTLLTPLYQRPLDFGADIVLHSTTKYIDGHDVTLGGAVVLHNGTPAWRALPTGPSPRRLRWTRKSTGAVLAPFEAWLTLLGLKTLHLRTRVQWSTAARLAAVTRRHAAVVRTYYPGLPDHPGHAIHRKQATGDGGIIGLDLGALRVARAFTSRLRVVNIAENLGAADSLVTHPASMTHLDLAPERRRADGISDGLVRLSVGIEDPADLEADVLQALDFAARHPREVA